MKRHLRDPDLFKVSTDELRERQSEMLRACFKYHYESCVDYRKYCNARGISPESIKSLADAPKVPLLDSFETLRKRKFLSVPKESIVAKFSSSGTSGNPALWCPRDHTSLDWQGIGAIRMASDVSDIKAGETLLMVPDMPNMAFSQILKTYLPKVGHKISIGLKHAIVEGKPNFFPDIKAIKKFFESSAETKNIMGYPFTVAELKNFACARSLGTDGIIMTAGGWKAKDATMPYASLQRHELEKLFSGTFGIPPENVRDIYGSTELIFACWECFHRENGEAIKRKHVAPWMYALVLDPDTLKSVECGEVGRAAFLDFGNHSSPGFILTDDLVKLVSDEGCECGRPGQIIEHIDRVKETGFRGCAFTVKDKLFSEEYLEEKPFKEAAGERGLLEYLKEHYSEVDTEFIQKNMGDFTLAMEAIIEVLKTIEADESLLESIDFVLVAKKLCYQRGKVTVLDQEELIKAFPNISRDRILKILDRLEQADLLVKEETKGKIQYHFTKKADELGSALFPMIMWGLKWSEKKSAFT
jgi:long-chain-fatty-acid---luciferin-component ligase